MKKDRLFIPSKTAITFNEIFKSLASDYFIKISKEEKEICSFGIFTDSDISGFVFYHNIKGRIEELVKNDMEKSDEDFDAKISLDSYKWWMPEWIVELVGKEPSSPKEKKYKQLEKMMSQLIEKSEWDFEDDKNTFAHYKSDMFDLFCDALKELKNEDVFKNTTDDFFLLVQESDNGIYDNRAKSLKKILSEQQFKEYKIFNES